VPGELSCLGLRAGGLRTQGSGLLEVAAHSLRKYHVDMHGEGLRRRVSHKGDQLPRDVLDVAEPPGLGVGASYLGDAENPPVPRLAQFDLDTVVPHQRHHLLPRTSSHSLNTFSASRSTRLQYALAEHAVALGWARSQVAVIDDDLGVSAAAADSRRGFARLVAEVTMGRAGVVLGIEMSRLARTGRYWHQLLELCCLSGVLLADPDGVYDPGFYNDRLLLDLKGTMSEAELCLIRQRMLSGRLAKAERGELAIPLPIGYVRRLSGEAVLDPDDQARHVVGLVFSAFRRLGTLNGVLRYLVDQQVQLPVRVHAGSSKGDLEWRRPTRETLQNMLHSPVYAGYYAYGRRRSSPAARSRAAPAPAAW
jgi:DNA invertase Pin-like site-specific DNA recombinase